MTFDVLADDLEAVRADHGLERIAVLGHSILGNLAIEYARRRPQSVSHLIVAGTPPRGDMAWLSSQSGGPSIGPVLDADGPGADAPALLRRSIRRHPPVQRPCRRPPPRGAVIATLAPGWDVTVDAAPLRAPIFIAHGRYDYTVPWTLWQGVAESLPRAAFHVFDQSGHHLSSRSRSDSSRPSRAG
jgi:proline iminopeptidase